MKLRITYQKRLQLLMWGSLVIVFICYLMAFRKTIDERKTLVENRKLSSRVSNSGIMRKILLNELLKLESGVKTKLRGEINNQEKLLEIVHRKANGGGVRIIEIPKQESSEEKGFLINNQAIVVQGKFTEMLLFVRAIEEEKSIGNICSSEFYRFTDKKSGFSATRLRLYLQDLIPIKK